MSPCLYCGKAAAGDFCSVSCEQNYYVYRERVEHFGMYYLAGLVLSIALFILPVFLGYYTQLIGTGLLVFGMIHTVFPFAPHLVIDRFGVRRSMRTIRFAGLALMLLGAVLMVLPMFL